MTLKTGGLFVAAALAAGLCGTLGAAPAMAQDSGVSITIRKAPSYLNTRTTPNPGSASPAARSTSALYQPVFQQSNSIAFARYPLPSTFTLPGY